MSTSQQLKILEKRISELEQENNVFGNLKFPSLAV